MRLVYSAHWKIHQTIRISWVINNHPTLKQYFKKKNESIHMENTVECTRAIVLVRITQHTRVYTHRSSSRWPSTRSVQSWRGPRVNKQSKRLLLSYAQGLASHRHKWDIGATWVRRRGDGAHGRTRTNICTRVSILCIYANLLYDSEYVVGRGEIFILYAICGTKMRYQLGMIIYSYRGRKWKIFIYGKCLPINYKISAFISGKCLRIVCSPGQKY